MSIWKTQLDQEGILISFLTENPKINRSRLRQFWSNRQGWSYPTCPHPGWRYDRDQTYQNVYIYILYMIYYNIYIIYHISYVIYNILYMLCYILNITYYIVCIYYISYTIYYNYIVHYIYIRILYCIIYIIYFVYSIFDLYYIRTHFFHIWERISHNSQSPTRWKLCCPPIQSRSVSPA